MMRTSSAGIALIKRFEGCELKAYQDSVSVWTIGVGHTGGVEPGQVITEEEADAFLREDLQDAENCVNASVLVPLSQSKFDALVSLVFNIGCGNFQKSTLLRELNAGAGMMLVADQFKRWNKAGGVVLNGLTKRRAAEAEMFLA